MCLPFIEILQRVINFLRSFYIIFWIFFIDIRVSNLWNEFNLIVGEIFFRITIDCTLYDDCLFFFRLILCFCRFLCHGRRRKLIRIKNVHIFVWFFRSLMFLSFFILFIMFKQHFNSFYAKSAFVGHYLSVNPDPLLCNLSCSYIFVKV